MFLIGLKLLIATTHTGSCSITEQYHENLSPFQYPYSKKRTTVISANTTPLTKPYPNNEEAHPLSIDKLCTNNAGDDTLTLLITLPMDKNHTGTDRNFTGAGLKS